MSNFLTEEGWANFQHISYCHDNPCDNQFVNCEGDCSNCPNRDFFRHVEIERKKLKEKRKEEADCLVAVEDVKETGII